MFRCAQTCLSSNATQFLGRSAAMSPQRSVTMCRDRWGGNFPKLWSLFRPFCVFMRPVQIPPDVGCLWIFAFMRGQYILKTCFGLQIACKYYETFAFVRWDNSENMFCSSGCKGRLPDSASAEVRECEGRTVQERSKTGDRKRGWIGKYETVKCWQKISHPPVPGLRKCAEGEV